MTEHHEGENDQQLVEGADRRARIIALMKRSPGQDFNRQSVADFLGTKDMASVGTLLTDMAVNDQINMRQSGNNRYYWYGGKTPASPPPAVPTKRRNRRRLDATPASTTAFSMTETVDHLTIAQARELYEMLHRMFGKKG